MKNYLKIKNIFFPLDKNFIKDKKLKIYNKTLSRIDVVDNNKKHRGNVLTSINKFKILDCESCKYIHCYPIPSKKDLDIFYKKQFYKSNRKKNYFLNQKKQIKWWNKIFLKRLDRFKEILNKKGSIIDIGCGPGFFIKTAKENGWKVSGIDPSSLAIEFAKKKLKLKNVKILDYQDLAKEKKKYDVIYSNGVIEHIADPKSFLDILSKILKKRGIIFLSAANDFNIFQYMSVKTQKKPWWIVPPEHINYFRVNDISKIFDKKKFDLKYLNTTFPIEFFLLMGEDYIKNKKIGKQSHLKRTIFEKNFENFEMTKYREQIYKNFSNLGLGRAIEIIVQKL